MYFIWFVSFCLFSPSIGYQQVTQYTICILYRDIVYIYIYIYIYVTVVVIRGSRSDIYIADIYELSLKLS